MESQYASPHAHVTNALGVFFIFLSIFFYAAGIDATSYVYCSELFPTHVRSQGMAFSNLDDSHLLEYGHLPQGKPYSIGKDQMVVLCDVHRTDDH